MTDFPKPEDIPGIDDTVLEGCIAYRKGKRLSDCPYKSIMLAPSWKSGWRYERDRAKHDSSI